jgi:hypothetical protein
MVGVCRKQVWTSIACIMLILVLFSVPVQASQITLSFSGTINRVVAGDYTVGQKVSGFVTYDSNTPMSWESGGSAPYDYNYAGAVTAFSIAGRKVDLYSQNIVDLADFREPRYREMTFHDGGYDRTTGLRESLFLVLGSANLWDNPFKLPENPNLSDLSEAYFEYSLEQVGLPPVGFIQDRFYADVDSLEIVTAVPEPASVMLLGLACVGLAGWRKRRKI